MTAGFLILAALAIFVRSDGWLRRYKYTWAALGIALLLLVFLFGEVTGGARLTLRIGPFSGQPSELLKVILVVFLALVLINGFSPLLQRLGFGRLPGDIRFRVRGREWFFPVTTTIILSMLFSLISKVI